MAENPNQWTVWYQAQNPLLDHDAEDILGIEPIQSPSSRRSLFQESSQENVHQSTQDDSMSSTASLGSREDDANMDDSMTDDDYIPYQTAESETDTDEDENQLMLTPISNFRPLSSNFRQPGPNTLTGQDSRLSSTPIADSAHLDNCEVPKHKDLHRSLEATTSENPDAMTHTSHTPHGTSMVSAPVNYSVNPCQNLAQDVLRVMRETAAGSTPSQTAQSNQSASLTQQAGSLPNGWLSFVLSSEH
jgi:hypothetical protein